MTTDTLSKLEALIEIQTGRVNRYLRLEHRSARYGSETTRAIAQLSEMYEKRFRIRSQLGLEQARAQGPIFTDPTYPFLSSDEALDRRALDNLIARGELDTQKVYEVSRYLAAVEREKAALMAAHPQSRPAR